MGADLYSYTTKYEGDASDALQKLRKSVFDSGDYSGSDNGYSCMDDIFQDFELMEAGGTGSIIDVRTIGNEPEMGTAAPMSRDDLEKVFGTSKPGESDLPKLSDYFDELERGDCRYILLYDEGGGEPTKIHFFGYSLD